MVQLGGKFTDGGSANQPVILQGGVGFSFFQVSLLLLSGGCGGDAGCRAGAGLGFRCVIFCLQILRRSKY